MRVISITIQRLRDLNPHLCFENIVVTHNIETRYITRLGDVINY